VFHVRQVKRKLKAFLVAQLPAKLAEADAADPVVVVDAEGVSHTVATPSPYEVHTTDKADLGGDPSLELIATDSTRAVDSVAKVYRHRIVVGITAGGDDEEVVTAQVEQYMWAIRMLLSDELLTPVDGAGPVDTGNEQYTPLQQRPVGVELPFVKGAFMEVFVKTLE
jgi:4-hydroxy-3-methylbut-2-enyl diphosphate reductase IspH